MNKIWKNVLKRLRYTKPPTFTRKNETNKQIRHWIIIFLLILNTLIAFSPINIVLGEDNWEIEGDTVFINDSYVYLSATPHTVYESGWVVFNFTSKVYTGDIDFCFGFNSSFMNPKSPQRWNGTHWIPFTGNWGWINYTFQNMTSWRYRQNIPIVQNVSYSIRCWMESRFNTTGKYFLALKPSSETIQESIQNGHFYYLDPWWDLTWSYYKLIPVSNACVNYTMPINISFAGPPAAWQDVDVNNNSQLDFDDIRFVALDNTTVLPHYTERKVDSDYVFMWVNTSHDIETDNAVLLYYGNPSAGNMSNEDTAFFDWIDDDSGWSDTTHLSMSGTPLGNLIFNVSNAGSPYTDHDLHNYNQTSVIVEMRYEQVDNWVSGDYNYYIYFGWNVMNNSNDAIFTRVWEMNESPNAYQFAYNNTDGTLRTPYDGVDTPRIGRVAIRTIDFIETLHDLNYTELDTSGARGFDDQAARLPTDNITYVRLRGWNDRECNITIHWIRIRKWNTTEPTWGTASAEQSGSSVTINSVYPTNDAVDIPLAPVFNANVESINGSGMNITWYSNSSGSWVAFGFNGSASGVGNGSYNQSGSNITLNATVYYWNLSIYDGYTTLNSPVYNFTTIDSNVPRNPSNVDTVFHTVGALNITWTNATNSDNTLVIRNNNSYPVNHSDGWERYNGTNEYFNDTLVNDTCYFRLFSYNATGGGNYSTGINALWGGLALNCFDEGNETAITFNIEITNEDATETYNATGLTNTHYVDQDDTPYGDNTVFIVSSDAWSGYQDRLYYYDLVENTFYNLSFYLPFNVSTIHLYYFRVEDIGGQPIADARANISVLVGDEYESIADIITDSNGYGGVQLNSSRTYQVNITASGYETELAKWYPDPDYYGIYYPKIFRLDPEAPDYENETTYEEVILFNGHIYDNDTLRVNFTDDLGETISTNICVYEMNTTTNATTWLNWDNRSSSSSFSFYVSINQTNCYEVVLILNHTTFLERNDSFIVCGQTRPHVNLTNQTSDESLFTTTFGSNPIGWANVIGFIVLIACLFGFGQQNAGLALILTGGTFLFINVVIGWLLIGVSLCILFIVFGVLAQWRSHQREARM